MEKFNIRRFFKSINWFEIIWITSAIVLLTIFIILYPDLMFEDKTNTLIVVFSIISTIACPICELLIAKQCRYWTIFALFFLELVDVILYFSLGLYSSALVSLCFWVPFDIFTFITWRGKNVDENINELTKVKTFNWWQNLIIIASMIGAGFLLGYLLNFIPNYPVTYVVAFTNVFEISNGIFLLLRHNEQWLAAMGCFICEIILWISLGHYVMLITVFAMIINTTYGFIKWLLYIRDRKKKAISSTPQVETISEQ